MAAANQESWVIIQPRRGGEGPRVVRALFAVFAATLVASAVGGDRHSPRAYLQPYQVLFDELDPAVQPVVREAALALDEICWWSTADQWPTVQQLADEQIAPFAELQLVGQRVQYQWQVSTGDGRHAYLGWPLAAELPALWLELEVTRSTGDPTHEALQRADGSHQRRQDGAVVHAALWLHPDPQAPAPLRPAHAGWRQILPRPPVVLEPARQLP